MTDDQYYTLLEQFANDHSIAKGGNIEVSITPMGEHFKPIGRIDGMKYEDVNYLKDQIDGASSFIFWLRRNNFKIVPQLKVKAMK